MIPRRRASLDGTRTLATTTRAASRRARPEGDRRRLPGRAAVLGELPPGSETELAAGLRERGVAVPDVIGAVDDATRSPSISGSASERGTTG
ncbi:MAG TPA: hypothetical protein VGB75_16460 [Jatrophihabitans sp.]|jgi:hypothetical protein|uniref:hypothetical protein n=1 Tax=Jatrophihabitans sp. TaxID=1932789 RepID=UPI002F05AC97